MIAPIPPRQSGSSRSQPVASILALVLSAILLAPMAAVWAAEVIPPSPAKYFNDYANVVKPATVDRLNHELEDFEKQTSNQLLVAIYPKMQTDSSIDDYCTRVYRAWKVGQDKTSNGAVLFVFVQDHKTRIQTGYGLEGALPDATCEDILQDRVRPLLKGGDFDGGMAAGVEAMMQAAKGEYKGSGKTAYQRQHPGTSSSNSGIGFGTILFIFIVFFVITSIARRRGYGGYGGGMPPIIFGGGGGGFGGGGGGGGSSDGGGFFSGGGGSSGGGGASGDW